jgi:hypothetical protein
VKVPPLEVRGAGAGHADRCWLTPEQKVALREVEPGEIGLRAKDAVPAAEAPA